MHTVSFYNALNQRIGTKDSGTQTWTVYDGMSADANPYADFNGSGTLTVRYLFGVGVVNGAVVNQMIAPTSSAGTTAWYLTDKLGSVRDIVSTSGTELDHVVYDSFGNIVTETNASNGERLKFAGMQFDSTTGQYYDHARSYGSGPGRFLSQDPTGFSAGDTNLYRYVNNGPVDGVDNSGLIWAPQTQAQVTALAPSMEVMITVGMAAIATSLEAAAASAVATVSAGVVASVPVVLGGVAVAEAAYANYLVHSLGYYSYQYAMAAMAGWALDAQLQQSRMQLAMMAQNQYMLLAAAPAMVAFAKKLPVPRTQEEMTAYMRMSFLLGIGILPPKLPPTKPTEKWKQIIDDLIQRGGGNPPVSRPTLF